jgi:hypothetical protein
MADGRLRAEWSQTSEVLAMLYNVNRPPKTKPIPAWKFSPFGKPAKREKTTFTEKESWGMFRAFFSRGAFGEQRR